MFSEFYDLKESPFKLTPDHKFFFKSTIHKKALGYLVYGLHQGEGFVVITGEVGAGKTTLAAHLLSTLDKTEFITAHIVTTMVGGGDMLRLIAGQFGLAVGTEGKAALLQKLERYFHDVWRSGRRALIVIDESQNLSLETLEELRMLSNLTYEGTAMVQSMLLGQPQFKDSLAHPDYDQLRQRIIASFHLGTLSRNETESYIIHRLRVVGWQNDPTLTPDAFDKIYEATEGVPRLTNLLCGRLLLFGMLEETHEIDGDAVDSVVEDMERESAQVLSGNRNRTTGEGL